MKTSTTIIALLLAGTAQAAEGGTATLTTRQAHGLAQMTSGDTTPSAGGQAEFVPQMSVHGSAGVTPRAHAEGEARNDLTPAQATALGGGGASTKTPR